MRMTGETLHQANGIPCASTHPLLPRRPDKRCLLPEIADLRSTGLGGTRTLPASCVIDDYLSRVGSNPYREIACIAAGSRATNVFVGAALIPDWQRLGPVIERAASSLLET